MPDRQTLGREAETRAATLLTAHGLQLLERNYRCRGGEIDLIMRDDRHLVFVEVRFRRSSRHGGALASVDSRKQRRLLTAAQHYLMTSRWTGPCRFDVVGFDDTAPGEWIRDAFSL